MVTSNTQNISPKPRKVNDSSGVLAKRVVVQGTNPRECARPSGANAGNIEGVAIHDADNGQHVGVQNEGEAILIAAGAIALNADVNIANAEGRVKTVSEATGTVIQYVGKAKTAATASGDQIAVALNISRYTMP